MTMADDAFCDWPVKSRRHFKDAGASSLGRGLEPQNDEEVLGARTHLARSRIAHDAAEMYQVPGSFASTTMRDPTTSDHFMTSYMAQTQGLNDTKRSTGRRKVQPPNLPTQKIIGPSAPTGPRRGMNDAAALQLGTTKASQHVPGFTGHIPSDAQARTQRVTERSTDKSLFAENYKGPVPGYTGKRML